MSKTDREAFLAEPRIAIVGIEEAGLPPRVVPLWYDYRPDRGVRILTSETSKKTALLRAAGAFSLCVQDDTPFAYRHVSVQGPITLEAACDLELDFRPLVSRYIEASKVDEFVRDLWSEDRLMFTMTPKKWVTADYSGQFSK